MIRRRKLFSHAAFLFLGWMLLSGGMVGCQSMGIHPFQEKLVEPQKAIEKQFGLALDAYASADYKKAAKIFSSIREQSEDAVIARKALYGLACAELMMADNQDSFHEAITIWNNWVMLAMAIPEFHTVETPLLFAPIVNEKIVFSNRSIPTEQTDAVSQHLTFVTGRYTNLKNELARVQGELAAAKEQSAERQQTIEILQQDILKLKDQIKAIELIDQKIQEKKKAAIPSTE